MTNKPDALYNRITVLRAENGLSRQQLADEIGVNYQTLGFIERGASAPSLQLALDLAEHFKLPVEAIFSRTPFPSLKALMHDAAIAEAKKAAEPKRTRR